jgi:hypothetical protein
LNCIPKVLIIDPRIDNARFSKVLMDRGNSLNILYAHTLRLMGIGLDQLRPSTTPFHGVAPGKHWQVATLERMGPIRDLKGVQKVWGALPP